MPQALVDQPAGVEPWRDNVLLKVLHHNKLEHLMYGLDQKMARQVMDRVGDRLLAAAHNSADELQSLIEGRLLVSDFANRDDVAKLITPQTSNVEAEF